MKSYSISQKVVPFRLYYEESQEGEGRKKKRRMYVRIKGKKKYLNPQIYTRIGKIKNTKTSTINKGFFEFSPKITAEKIRDLQLISTLQNSGNTTNTIYQFAKDVENKISKQNDNINTELKSLEERLTKGEIIDINELLENPETLAFYEEIKRDNKNKNEKEVNKIFLNEYKNLLAEEKRNNERTIIKLNDLEKQNKNDREKITVGKIKNILYSRILEKNKVMNITNSLLTNDNAFKFYKDYILNNKELLTQPALDILDKIKPEEIEKESSRKFLNNFGSLLGFEKEFLKGTSYGGKATELLTTNIKNLFNFKNNKEKKDELFNLILNNQDIIIGEATKKKEEKKEKKKEEKKKEEVPVPGFNLEGLKMPPKKISERVMEKINNDINQVEEYSNLEELAQQKLNNKQIFKNRNELRDFAKKKKIPIIDKDKYNISDLQIMKEILKKDYLNEAKQQEQPPEQPQTEQKAEGRGLTHEEVSEIMKNFKKAFYVGTFALDEAINFLKNTKLKKFSMIINNLTTNELKKFSGHFVALNVDYNQGFIEYYDPFGDLPPKSLMLAIYILSRNVFGDEKAEIKISRIKQQSVASDNCGFFCIHFLKDRSDNIPFRVTTGFKNIENNEKNINKFKKNFTYI